MTSALRAIQARLGERQLGPFHVHVVPPRAPGADRRRGVGGDLEACRTAGARTRRARQGRGENVLIRPSCGHRTGRAPESTACIPASGCRPRSRERSTPSTLSRRYSHGVSSDGRIRWPTPCRARNTTRLPQFRHAPAGCRKASRSSSSRSSSAMSCRPLPPVFYLDEGIVSVSVLSRDARRCDRQESCSKKMSMSRSTASFTNAFRRQRVHGVNHPDRARDVRTSASGPPETRPSGRRTR